ncbi:MAG: PilZ domain-containing protein [Deltaproteobacteria bacterium]|nr:PilZ domain-containing protein [Deltaproteobacteria bacterium]
MESDRRKFPRLKAPVLCRPAGLLLRLFAPSQERRAIDISLGGMRIFSDDPVKQGQRLELELFLPSGPNVVCKAEVAWVEELPKDAPARYDVGIRFTELREQDKARLGEVLAAEG